MNKRIAAHIVSSIIYCLLIVFILGNTETSVENRIFIVVCWLFIQFGVITFPYEEFKD